MTDNTHTTDVLQLVLDHNDLQQYFHAEIAERKPLRILKNASVEGEPKLTKFDAAVVYESEQQLQDSNQAYLEFQQVSIDEESARVQFTYPVEGIRGEATLVRDADSWRIDSYVLAES